MTFIDRRTAIPSIRFITRPLIVPLLSQRHHDHPRPDALEIIAFKFRRRHLQKSPFSSSTSSSTTSNIHETAHKPPSTILEVIQHSKRAKMPECTVFRPSTSSNPTEEAKAQHWSVISSHNNFYSSASTSSSTSPSSIYVTSFLSNANSVRSKFLLAFLPKDYPSSVTPDYLPYSIYQFFHSVTGTITGTLATQALLQALGMGAAVSIGLAATTNWIVKDGFGLLGGVIYAALVSNKFDSHPKQYRFYSALALQVATVLELMTPLVPHLFLPLASASNIGKNVAWLAASATRAAMHRGFTREDNLGDVTAKAGVQSTAAGLAGTAMGVGVSYIVGTEPMMLGMVFVPLCVGNIWCAYQANVCVVTRNFNLERAELALNGLIQNLIICDKEEVAMGGAGHNGTHHIPSRDHHHRHHDRRSTLLDECTRFISSPEEIGPNERFLRPHKSPFSVPLLLDPNLSNYLPKMSHDQADAFLSGKSLMSAAGVDPRYRILVCESADVGSKDEKYQVCMWMLQDSTTRDLIRGFYHSCVVRRLLEDGDSHMNSSSSEERDSNNYVIQTASYIVNCTFESMMVRLRTLGWDLEHVHITEHASKLVLVYSSA